MREDSNHERDQMDTKKLRDKVSVDDVRSRRVFQKCPPPHVVGYKLKTNVVREPV